MLEELIELFYAAVQNKPSAREKIVNLLDSLDVSREEDRETIDYLSEIAQRSGQQWYESIYDIAKEGVSDAWYIMAFCEFYGFAGAGSYRRAALCLMHCEDHEDANHFWYDHDDIFSIL